MSRRIRPSTSSTIAGVLATIGALLVVSLSPVAASAADDVFYEGWLINSSVRSGYTEYLDQTSARSLSGDGVCVAALYDDAVTQAGNVECSNTLAVHAYCHCDPKYGYARSLHGYSVNARARMAWPS